jgi:long-chain acyl-CoA synthetase
LIVLAHRRHFRQPGNERNERIFKSRWDAVLVEPDTIFGVGRNRALLDGAREAIALLPDKIERKAKRLRDRLDRSDKKLAQIEEMIRLYLPFMYESFYVFQARALHATPALEPELRFAPERIDWRKYWIEVHVPGLRRWAFPLIEGKRPERYRPDHPVRLPTALPMASSRLAATDASLEMAADAASAEE